MHSRLALWLCGLIILAGIAARSVNIRQILGEVHPTRQYDTAAVARNFAEGQMNFLYPQIDWAGGTPGYVELDCPIYSYSVAALYRIFGIQEWLGRAFNIGVYGLSAIVLFSLVRRLFCERTALLTVFFYTVVPLSFKFTRTFQPDALAAFGSLLGVYYFWRWTEEKKTILWVAAGLGLAVAVAIKPTNLYLGLPLMYLALRQFGWSFLKRPEPWAVAILSIVPALLWYRHAHSFWTDYGTSFFRHYLQLDFADRYEAVFRGWLFQNMAVRLFKYVATPAGLVLLAVGMLKRPPKGNWLLHWWAAGFAVSVLMAAQNHWGHEYYQLPIVFVTAAWMGWGTATLWTSDFAPRWLYRGAALSLSLAVAAPLVMYLPDWTRDSKLFAKRMELGRRVAQLTEPEALLITVEQKSTARPQTIFEHRTAKGELLWGFPVDLYLSHRKGWSVGDKDATPAFIDSLRQQGAKYLVTFFPKALFRNVELTNYLEQNCVLLERTENWLIFALGPAPGSEVKGP
jgi:4-amino-4-deoxy-L-arabinose transferase-like glycosyltransferase